MTTRAPVPFTVIGGFLGAGKTTLVNRLLGETRDLRLVVLVNDFGAINIDASLIAAREGDTIALTNGCACCAVGDDFGRGILQALARVPAPEHILVEASGVADPGILAEIATLDPDLSLSGVIVLADAATLPGLLGDRRVGDTVRRQIEAADLVVLTKADLVDEAARMSARASAAGVAPKAVIIEAERGDLPAALLLGPRAPVGIRAPAMPSDHGARFATATLHAAAPVAEAALRRALDALPDGVLRAKGFVRAAEGHDLLVQRVGRRLDIAPSPLPPPMHGLVLIGDRDVFRAAALLAPLGFSTESRRPFAAE